MLLPNFVCMYDDCLVSVSLSLSFFLSFFLSFPTPQPQGAEQTYYNVHKKSFLGKLIFCNHILLFLSMSKIMSNWQPTNLIFNFRLMTPCHGNTEGNRAQQPHFWLEKSLKLWLCEQAHCHVKATHALLM